MSVSERKLIASRGEWNTRIWISYDHDEDAVSFCENCCTAEDEVLTNVGLQISGARWRELIAEFDRHGCAAHPSVSLLTLPEWKVVIVWVTQVDQLRMGNSYAPGRVFRLVTNRDQLNID